MDVGCGRFGGRAFEVYIVFIKQNLTIIFESWIIILSITVYYLQNKLFYWEIANKHKVYDLKPLTENGC